MAEPYRQPRFGGFQPAAYLGGAYVNDDKKPLEELAPLKLGASMTKKSVTGTFDTTVKRLYEGEPYRPSAEERKEARAKAAAALAGNPFRPPNPSRKSMGRGDYYGALGKPNPHIGPGTDRKVLKGEVTSATPNIRTSPSKRGSYGTPGTTLSQRYTGLKGVVGEYSYKPDPYDGARIDANEAAKASAAAKVTDKPFKPSSYMKKGQGNNTPGVLLARTPYMPPPPLKEEPEKEAEPAGKAFAPASYPKKGATATLSKMPAYEADPWDLKLAAQREARKVELEKYGANKAFAPPNVPRSSATVSIIRMNIRR